MTPTPRGPLRPVVVLLLVLALCRAAAGQPAAQNAPQDSPSRHDLQRLEARLAEIQSEVRDVATSTKHAFDDVLEEIREEPPLISELWFGFVSDRFNAALTWLLGFDAGASQPLWAAGFASLLLLLLKGLSFLIGRSRPGSRLAAVLGNGFTIVVSLYLVVLTGSLFMLALHTPDSGIERFDAQLEASDQLTSEMHDASARIDALIARIDRSSAQIDGLEQLVDDQSAKRTVVKVPSASVVDLRRIGDLSSAHLPVIADLQANLASLRAEVRQIEGRQPSMLWKSFVGIAAAVVLGLAIAGLYEVFAK